MFQFTTTNVINSNKDLTTNKPLWSAQAAKDDKPASFNVKRVNNFLAPNITAIYKAEASDPELAKVTMDLSEVNGKEGEQYRLIVYVGLSLESQDSRYSNDMILKGKPFGIDFIWKSDVNSTVESLVKTIKKYEMLVYGDKLLNASYNGSYITIEATTEYQRFKKVNIEKFDQSKYSYLGDYTVIRSLEDLEEKSTNAAVTPTTEGYFVGKVGFGTYSFLLHNLRLPTSARTRAFATNLDETPIVGAKYNQYTIHYCVNRGILGNNAVGDIVKSATTHVFYVNLSVALDFETALGTVGTVISVAPGTKTPDPDTVSSTLEELAKEVKGIKTILASKLDTLSSGNGINIDDDDTISVLLDGNSLTVSAAGLKITE